MEIDFWAIEKKWQDRWAAEGIFRAENSGVGGRGSGVGKEKGKFYVLEMFPYPSSSGLHMGHALNYSIGDVLARFKRMKGFDVLYPMGFDALGLPAENAAIKAGEHPKAFTERAIKNYVRQMKELGLSYDWSRTLSTMDPEYYKWNQFFFLKFLEAGLIYKKKAAVNWCPSCDTVISNEQAQGGICERCKSDIEVRHLDEWFMKTTKYADELLSGLDSVDWPEKIKAMQTNWIGRSEGTEIEFTVSRESGVGDQGSDDLGNKVILVDAINAFVIKGEGIFDEMHEMLKKYPNKKIVLTGANDEEYEKFNLKSVPYEVFTLKHNPDKSDPKYYKRLLEKFNLKSGDVIYFEHNKDAIKSAESIGIKTFYYDKNKRDLVSLKNFIEENIKPRTLADSRGHDKGDTWKIFTTRPDTIFGVTFMVVSAQHERLDELVTEGQRKDVDKFLSPRDDSGEPNRLRSTSEKEMATLEKEGVFSGSYAVNPANGEKVPIWIGNFVVADYGSGMVMAVPAHDQRDYLFAEKYNIPIREVVRKEVAGRRSQVAGDFEVAYTGEGLLCNSGEFDGVDNIKAKEKITNWLIKKKLGKQVVNYKLRDWGFSRQRYWGTPIPIVNCEKCGAVPVPEKDLPVVLPEDVKFGKGNPLETNEEWLNVKCPKCGGKGRREAETMDTFFDSSWYFLRYPDNKNDKAPFDKKILKKWLPVDQYIGGTEHACLHLIYARFFTKVLRDLGFLDFDEPFMKLFNQGMLHGPDGDKMSKSKGNVINPDEISKKYGMDTARFFLLSLAAPDKERDWSEKGIAGSLRFIRKIFDSFDKVKVGKSSKEFESMLHSVVKDVSQYYDEFGYRKATIRLKELFDFLAEQDEVAKKDLEIALKLLSPICPHIAEELWSKIGNKDFISVSEWPEFDEKKILEKGVIVGDLNEKIIARIKGIMKDDTDKIYVYVMPFELVKVDALKIGEAVGREVVIFAVNDSEKVDPKGVAKRTKPGMAAIYLE